MRTLLLSVLCAASLSACAQAPSPDAAASDAAAAQKPAEAVKTLPGTPEDRARQAIESINPQVVIDSIGAAPLPGFREVIVSGQVLYVSDDGKYLLQGSLFDVGAKREVGHEGLAAVRKKLLATVPVADRIVFAPANPTYTVSVFTDIECGYCRKLHEDIAEYNKRGIAVEYLAFPRMGLASKDATDMISVWCASDRKAALTAAKSGQPVQSRNCTNPVAMQYNLGQQLGINGTPAIFAADGSQLGGYLPPAQLKATLDRMEGGGSR